MSSETYQRWRSLILPEPQSLSQQDKLAIAQHNAAVMAGQSRREFSGDTPFNAALLRSLICTCGFHFQHIQSILRHVDSFAQSRRTAGIPFERMMPEAFSLSQALLRDDQFRKTLRSTFGSVDPDCKEISATYFAAYLCVAKRAANTPRSIRMSLVTGLVFDETYAPNGTGHIWVALEGEFVDASIAPSGTPRVVGRPYEGYVPIVSVDTTLNHPAMSFSRRMSIRALWTSGFDRVRAELISAESN